MALQLAAERQGLHFCMRVDGRGVDTAFKHPKWPTEAAAKRIDTESEMAVPLDVSAYGDAVFRAYKAEDNKPEVVMLDPYAFKEGVSLPDVLAESVQCALDENDSEAVVALLGGFLTLVDASHMQPRMRNYLNTAIATDNDEVIAMYVDFAIRYTSRGTDEAQAFMKNMAHAVRDLPQSGLYTYEKRFALKAALLQELGMAWIRKAMPPEDIDWLPEDLAKARKAYERSPRAFFDKKLSEAGEDVAPEQVAYELRNDSIAAFNYLRGYVAYLEETRKPDEYQAWKASEVLAQERIERCILTQDPAPNRAGSWPSVFAAMSLTMRAEAALEQT